MRPESLWHIRKPCLISLASHVIVGQQWNKIGKIDCRETVESSKCCTKGFVFVCVCGPSRGFKVGNNGWHFVLASECWKWLGAGKDMGGRKTSWKGWWSFRSLGKGVQWQWEERGGSDPKLFHSCVFTCTKHSTWPTMFNKYLLNTNMKGYIKKHLYGYNRSILGFYLWQFYYLGYLLFEASSLCSRHFTFSKTLTSAVRVSEIYCLLRIIPCALLKSMVYDSLFSNCW